MINSCNDILFSGMTLALRKSRIHCSGVMQRRACSHRRTRRGVAAPRLKNFRAKSVFRVWGLRLSVIVEIPTWGVNLVVAGAQVGLPTKQPDVLKFPSQSKAN